MNKHKRRPNWAREIIQDAEKNGAPDGSSKGSNRTHTHSSYVALLCHIIDEKPSNNEDEAEKKECKDAMIEEYQPIMKNDVWDVVQRPVVKSVVPSKWIYKIKHVADGSIEKHTEMFVVCGFSQKEGKYFKEAFIL